MVDTKPTTLWAAVSLACGVFGCLASLAFVAMAERYGEIANRSAGIGAIWMGMHMMLVAALCLLGVLFGVVALVRVRSGQCKGRRMAWTGIVLGCLPLAFALVSFLLSTADSNPLRRLLTFSQSSQRAQRDGRSEGFFVASASVRLYHPTTRTEVQGRGASQTTCRGSALPLSWRQAMAPEDPAVEPDTEARLQALKRALDRLTKQTESVAQAIKRLRDERHELDSKSSREAKGKRQTNG
jgi:hypothetical protein